MYDALAREHAATTVHECAAQRSLIETHRDLIWKARQHAALDRAWLGLARFDVETFVARDRDELLPKLRRLASSACIHRQARAALRIEVVLLRKAERADQHKEIGIIIRA